MNNKLFIKTGIKYKEVSSEKFKIKKQLMALIAEETNVHIVTEVHDRYDLVYETDLDNSQYIFKAKELV